MDEVEHEKTREDPETEGVSSMYLDLKSQRCLE